jgi:PAS domain S-box-containing protein
MTRRRTPFFVGGLVAESWFGLLLGLGLQVASGAPRNVLILTSEDTFRPGFLAYNLSLRAALTEGGTNQIEFYTETLDQSRFPDGQYAARRLDYLRWKYGDRHIDAVVAGPTPALDFMIAHRDELFPGAPVVFASADEALVKQRKLPPGFTGVPTRFDVTGTLELALKLQPGLREVVVIVGKSSYDESWEQTARKAFQRFESRVRFRYLKELAMPALLQELSRLPPQTAVVYFSLFRDAAGTTRAVMEAGPEIARHANVPVYSPYETMIGLGVVGGCVSHAQADAQRVAALVQRIFKGEDATSIPVQEPAPCVYTVDWRALQRWGLSESRLPPDSQVRYRHLSLWQEYKWPLVTIHGVALVEAFLIYALVRSRRRRRQAEEKFRLSVETSPNAIILVNHQGRIVLANPQTETVLGYTRAELTGKAIESLIPEPLRGAHSTHRQAFQQAPQIRGMGKGRELSARRKDGSTIEVEIALNPIHSGGEVLVLATIADITERKRKDLALRESEERMSLAAEAANLGMWIWEIPPQRIWATERFRQLFGFSPSDEIRFETIQARIHPQDWEQRRRALERALETGGSYDIEYRLVGARGGERWVASKGRAERDSDGRPLRLLGVYIDITARRLAQEEARQVSGRLIHAQEDERTRLARELHDDLSQSLALLSVDLDLLGQQPPESAQEAGLRMNELAQQVRDLSSDVHRLSHELHPAKLEQLGLPAALHSFCRDISATHKIAVRFESEPINRSVPPGVALCLYRIAQEAVQNVVKHSGATEAQIDLSAMDENVTLTIKDDGRGFDIEAVQGNGSLGLVSMRERARLVHGQFSVESEIDRGTRVEVRVPLE